jgi:hypothetical protein
MVRPEGLEPPAYRFEACRSIQLSYGRVWPSMRSCDRTAWFCSSFVRVSGFRRTPSSYFAGPVIVLRPTRHRMYVVSGFSRTRTPAV